MLCKKNGKIIPTTDIENYLNWKSMLKEQTKTKIYIKFRSTAFDEIKKKN